MKTLASVLVLGLAVAAPGAIAPAAAASAADGVWSVLIVTEKGTCDRGYRYPVRIKNGRVLHADAENSSFNISGGVRGSSIKVTVSRGSQSASGTGRIGGGSASGTWRSASGDCSGNWSAEKRS